MSAHRQQTNMSFVVFVDDSQGFKECSWLNGTTFLEALEKIESYELQIWNFYIYQKKYTETIWGFPWEIAVFKKMVRGKRCPEETPIHLRGHTYALRNTEKPTIQWLFCDVLGWLDSTES